MSRKRAALLLALLALVGGGLTYSAWRFGWPPFGPRAYGPRTVGPDELYSNILPDDYVGPETCAKCHENEYSRWSSHPHRFMNQMASAKAVKGDFDNHVWQVRPGHQVTFSVSDGDYLMTVDRPAGPRTRYKVTRTVGSRFVQFYIGVQTEGAEPTTNPRYTTEHKLPFSYWFRLKRWLPSDYFDVGEAWYEPFEDDQAIVPGATTQAPLLAYSTTCVHCHNTYPHAYRVFRKSLAGFPDAVIEPDHKQISDALAGHVKVGANSSDFEDLPTIMNYKTDLVTVGISCESCHLGGREHAKLKKEISFFPTHPHVSVRARKEDKPFTGKRDDPATSQGICAQCHSARAVATYPNGVRVRNSSESLDMAEGACMSQIRCVNCHEPHTAGVPSGGPTAQAHLDACVGCHEKYDTPQKAAAHSRHSEKSGVDCLDCHMPRISQGVDVMSRTHRISMPVESSMISDGSPNACNLCHIDKSVKWTLGELKRGWKQDVRPAFSTPAARLEQPAGKVWLASERPIARMTAIDAYSRSPQWKAHLPELMRGLDDPHPTGRVFAQFAMEKLAGRQLTVAEFDVLAGPRRRRGQIDGVQTILQQR